MYLQVAQKVERQGQEEIKAKAEAVAGAFEGGARTRSRAGRAGGSGSTSAWNPTKRELAVMLDKDPDKYDDWLAIQVWPERMEGIIQGCGFTGQCCMSFRRLACWRGGARGKSCLWLNELDGRRSPYVM